jgi:hypothetical protein
MLNPQGPTPPGIAPALPKPIMAIVDKAVLKGSTGATNLIYRLYHDHVSKEAARQAADEFVRRTRTAPEVLALLIEKRYARAFKVGDETSAGGRDDAATAIRRLLDGKINSGLWMLFHNSAGKPYISVKDESDRCRNTHPVDSVEFEGLLRGLYDSIENERLPPAQALKDLRAYAMYKAMAGGSYDVHCRVAHQDGVTWVDLANELREVVKVTSEGYSIVLDCPVFFERPATMLPLPHPVSGGNLEALLKPFLNVDDPDDLKLLVAWQMASVQPSGSYPILQVNGPEGSAKTTLAMVQRLTIDPTGVPTQTFPSNMDDLILAVTKSHVSSFDNVSSIDKQLSDKLCTVATGQAQSKRAHYTNEDLIILKVRKPLILNGIPDFAGQPDLIDRSIKIDLPRIPDDKRKTEEQFWADFGAAHPAILGALLDVAVAALKRLPTVSVSGLPRMSDFARWITACEEKLGWERGKFLRIFNANRESSKEITLDDCPVISALTRWCVHKTWQGNMTELLTELNRSKLAQEANHPEWPKRPNTLSEILKRFQTSLEQVNLKITFNKRTNSSGRTITIQKTS